MRSAKPNLFDGLCGARCSLIASRRIRIDSAPTRRQKPRTLFVQRHGVAHALDADVVAQVRETPWPDATVSLDGVPDAEEVHTGCAHSLGGLEMFDRFLLSIVRLVRLV